MKEGLRRIIKAISVLAWACLLAIGPGLGLVLLYDNAPGVVFCMAIATGALAFALLQGLAWILAGFSGSPRGEDGLVRWENVIRRRCHR